MKFTVTVVNKSDKPLDLGLTYISVQSNDEEAHHLVDSLSGLKGPPDKKVLKGRESEFDLGFGRRSMDVVMEVALHDQPARLSVRDSTQASRPETTVDRSEARHRLLLAWRTP